MKNDTANRCDQLEARWEAKSATRDAEIGELREAVAGLLARTGGIEGANTANATAIAELQRRPQPGILTFVSPAIGAAALVGSLGGYVLSVTIVPIQDRITRIDQEISHVQGDVTGAIKVVQDRQDDARQRISRLEGRVPEMDKRIEAIDNHGPRGRR